MEKYRHVRINVLFSEYLNDTTIPHGTRAIETQRNLVNHLLLKQLNESKKAVKTSTQFSDTPLQIQPVQITQSFSESSYLQTQAQPPLHESIIFDNESVVIKKRSRRVTTLEKCITSIDSINSTRRNF